MTTVNVLLASHCRSKSSFQLSSFSSRESFEVWLVLVQWYLNIAIDKISLTHLIKGKEINSFYGLMKFCFILSSLQRYTWKRFCWPQYQFSFRKSCTLKAELLFVGAWNEKVSGIIKNLSVIEPAFGLLVVFASDSLHSAQKFSLQEVNPSWILCSTMSTFLEIKQIALKILDN